MVGEARRAERAELRTEYERALVVRLRQLTDRLNTMRQAYRADLARWQKHHPELLFRHMWRLTAQRGKIRKIELKLAAVREPMCLSRITPKIRSICWHGPRAEYEAILALPEEARPAGYDWEYGSWATSTHHTAWLLMEERPDVDAQFGYVCVWKIDV